MVKFIDRRSDQRGRRREDIRRFRERAKEIFKRVWLEELEFSDIPGGDNTRLLDSNMVGKVIGARDELAETRFHSLFTKGRKHSVFSGNKEFSAGDRVPRVPKELEAEALAVHRRRLDPIPLTVGELFASVMANLQLPEREKRRRRMGSELSRHAGYMPTDKVTNFALQLSLKKALMRRMALGIKSQGSIDRLQKGLDEKLHGFASDLCQRAVPKGEVEPRIAALIADQRYLAKAIAAKEKGHWLESSDILVKTTVSEVRPSSTAVLFILVNNAQINEISTDVAKRTAALYYRLIKQRHPQLDLVLMPYSDSAKVVKTSSDLFNQKGSDEAAPSLAYKEMVRVIKQVYPGATVYVVNFSTGGQMPGDRKLEDRLLKEEVLPRVELFFNVELLPKNGNVPPSVDFKLLHGLPSDAPVISTMINYRTAVLPIFAKHFSRPGFNRECDESTGQISPSP